jgi:transposase InsO family protein
MADEQLPVQPACRILGVSESGYYAWKSRPPSERSIRHAWLTDLILQVHADSRQTYGWRRVHAELTMGHGIEVGHCAVELLMRRAGIQGITGRPRFRRVPNVATASDLVERQFHRDDPNRLWVTDITEHPTREGKVYCAVVLDAFSRRVVGWSIDASPTASLVTNALGMAIDQRDPDGSTVIHSDQGTQGEFNRLSQHLMMTEVLDGSSTTSSRSSNTAKDEIAGSTAAPARSRTTVLDRDCQGARSRRSSCSRWRVAAGWPTSIP